MPVLTLKIPVNPTEAPEKVAMCITNLFGDVQLERTEEGFSLETHDVERLLGELSRLVQRQRILDASRRQMRRSLSIFPAGFRFLLNKQAAAVGTVSFVNITEEEPPLGAIDVRITSPNAEEIIDKFFPKAAWFFEEKYSDNKPK